MCTDLHEIAIASSVSDTSLPPITPVQQRTASTANAQSRSSHSALPNEIPRFESQPSQERTPDTRAWVPGHAGYDPSAIQPSEEDYLPQDKEVRFHYTVLYQHCRLILHLLTVFQLLYVFGRVIDIVTLCVCCV